MSEAADTGRASAGALLRAAREKQGLHIAALAAAIKVTPRKLDALEHDRYEELPGATFTRALAQTICRSLKIDPQPVLALLPQAESPGLDAVAAGSLNAPFRDRPGREEPSGIAVAAIRPMVWAAAALMLAALVVYFVPGSFWRGAPAEVAAVLPAPSASPAPTASPTTSPVPAMPASAEVVVQVPPPSLVAASVAEAAPTPASQAAATMPAVAKRPVLPPVAVAVAPTAAPASAALAGTVRLHAAAPSWIEARDAKGQVLLSRVVQPGESVGFDGSLPIRLTIGNAPATTLSFRGKPIDLAASTHDNVARLELQ